MNCMLEQNYAVHRGFLMPKWQHKRVSKHTRSFLCTILMAQLKSYPLTVLSFPKRYTENKSHVEKIKGVTSNMKKNPAI